MHDTLAIKARWVILDAINQPLENATIMMRYGLIEDVTTKDHPQAIDLQNAVIIPALINAHTHLEFSSFQAPLKSALPFTSWIKELMQARQSSGNVAESLSLGLLESTSCGVYALGEIGTWSPQHLELFKHSAVSTVIYKECIGILSSQINERYLELNTWLEQAYTVASTVRIGISPHAPYSVHPQYFNKLVEVAVDRQLPMAMHLAETPAEIELLQHQTGEFRAFLERLNLWDEESFSYGMTISDFIQGLAQTPRASVIHGNYLNAEEIKLLQRFPQLTVVYCPRTHAYFQHSPHPWRDLFASGVRVALGTDSKGSNPDLRLWKEVQFLKQKFPEVLPQQLLQMATLNGAYALNLEDKLGSIKPGMLGRFAVANSNVDITDPWRCLFDPQTLIKGWNWNESFNH